MPMRSLLVALLACLGACGGDDEGSKGPTTTEDPSVSGHTGTLTDTTESVPTTGACTLSDNALRVLCDLELPSEGVQTVRFTADGAPERVFTTDGAASTRLVAWGLRPDTTYTWRVGEREGSVVTGPLPKDLLAGFTTVGEAAGFDAVLRTLPCAQNDYMVLVDTEGFVVWYEPTTLWGGGRTGYDWDPDGPAVLNAAQLGYQRTAIDGTVEEVLARGEDFDGTLHHDLETWGGFTYLLFERMEQGKSVDGVHVFDGSTLVGTFSLADHYDVTKGGSPFADWAHANSVEATEDGVIVVSLLNFSTVLAFDGDPGSPGFLDVLWTAAGEPNELPNPTYGPPATLPEGFSGQHNASLVDGLLWLFDNRGGGDHSRVAAYELQDDDVTLVESYAFADICTVQGGAIPVGGGVLGTCPSANDVAWWKRGEATPSWTLAGGCNGGQGVGAGTLNRAIPVRFDGAIAPGGGL